MSIRFQNSSEPIESQQSRIRLNTISNLLQQVQNRSNINIVKQIWSNIEDIQTLYSSQLRSLTKQINKNNSFYLTLKQVQKMLKSIASNFAEVLEQLPDRRIQTLYNNILHISFRLKTMQPTSIHSHSTRMKQHLLDQIKDEKKKRQNLQKQYIAVAEQLQRLSEISQNRAEQKQNQTEEYNQIQSKLIELAHEMNVMKQTNIKLKNSNDELKRQKSKLSQRLNQPCDECQSKDVIIKQLTLGFKKCSEELEQVLEQGNRYAQNEEIMKNQIQKFQQQVQNLHRIRLDRQNIIIEVQTELLDLKKQYDSKLSNQNLLKNKNNELEKEIIDFNNKCIQQQKEIESLKYQLEGLNEEVEQNKRLEKISELERENFLGKTEELENKIEEMESQQNQLIDMQDISENQIRNLIKQLEEKEKSMNIYMTTAERLRKQINELKRKQDDIIQQKSDESSDDGIIRIQSMIENTKPHNLYNLNEKKKSQWSTPNKAEVDLLNDSNKRSNPQVEIVEDQLLRMLLTQALSLESFIQVN